MQKGERKRFFQRKERETFLLKLLQEDRVWEKCGPVASLALGLAEQVVALVGGGGEVEFV